jgi:triacylglycerol lipase
MQSAYLVDAELAPALNVLASLKLTPASLPIIRDAMANETAVAPPTNPLVSVRPLMIPSDAPNGVAAHSIRVLAYLPEQSDAHVPVLLHIHGGGYVIGSPDMMDAANRELAAALKCAIFSVDYRLAPETRYPGAVEDCYAVLKWLTSNPDGLPIDVGLIGVKGESAGGGLAAALALLVRDRGEVTLAFQHLIYPMIDDRTCTLADPHPFTGEFVWGPENNRFGWTALLGTEPGISGTSSYAAAARADNLSGLPPTFISVGALDLFLEEDLEFARRLTRAGVAVELHVYPGAFHGFQMAPTARVSVAAERDSRDAIRRAFYG